MPNKNTIVALAIFSLLLTPASIYAQTNVGGLITSDQVWTKNGSPYIITSNTGVRSTLTIEAGTEVFFSDNTSIRILTGGSFRVLGQPSDSVYFRPINSTTFNNQIHFEPQSVATTTTTNDTIYVSGSVIGYAVFENFNSNISILKNSNQTGVNLLIHNSVFRNNSTSGSAGTGGGDTGVLFLNSQSRNTIFRNQFINNSGITVGAAIVGYGSRTHIIKSRFINNSSTFGAAINSYNSNEWYVSNSFFANNRSDYGPSFYHRHFTRAEFDNNEFRDNIANINGSVFYDDTSHSQQFIWVVINNNSFNNNRIDNNVNGSTIFGSVQGNNNVFHKNNSKYEIHLNIGTQERNLTNNYWSLYNADDIRSRIYDLQNDPDFNTDIANIVPFLSSPPINVPLPVELTSFNAIVDGRNIILNWTTLSETNNSGFHIEMQNHRSDSEWQSIAFIHGQGTSLQTTNYSHTINLQPPGLHYFRLKQVDYDGSINFSTVVEVQIEHSEIIYVGELHPNPTRNTFSTSIISSISQPVKINIYNSLGIHIAEVINEQFNINEFRNITFDFSNYPRGLYFIRFSGTNQQTTKSILLQ